MFFRITEWLRLEEAFGGHLFQPPCSRMSTESRLLKIMFCQASLAHLQLMFLHISVRYSGAGICSVVSHQCMRADCFLRLFFWAIVLFCSLHWRCGKMCRPKQATDHRHDSKLRGKKRLEHLWTGNKASKYVSHGRNQSDTDWMQWTTRSYELPGGWGPKTYHQAPHCH